jgi:hypothetical protein
MCTGAMLVIHPGALQIDELSGPLTLTMSLWTLLCWRHELLHTTTRTSSTLTLHPTTRRSVLLRVMAGTDERTATKHCYFC